LRASSPQRALAYPAPSVSVSARQSNPNRLESALTRSENDFRAIWPVEAGHHGRALALVDDPALDYTVSTTLATILRHLRAHPDSAPCGILDASGIGCVRERACQRMAADGQLITDTAGRNRSADTPGTGALESVPDAVTANKTHRRAVAGQLCIASRTVRPTS
jgi:hypothetical protein